MNVYKKAENLMFGQDYPHSMGTLLTDSSARLKRYTRFQN